MRSRTLTICATAVLLTATIALLIAGFSSPLGYDEAYNLQVPLHLIHDGRYATDGAVYPVPGVRDFDVYISTGPTLLLPVAGAMKLLGTHFWVARLVGTVTYAVLVAAAALIGWRAGRWPGLLVAWLAVLAINLRTDGILGIRGTGDVLGEVLATALVLTAAYVLVQAPGRAGVLLGLAVLTKFLVILVVPVFVVLSMVAVVDGRALLRFRAALTVVGGVCVPLVAWNVYRLVVIGPTTYRERYDEFVYFFLHSGSGLGIDKAPRFSRAEAVHSVLHGTTATGVLLVGIAGVLVAVAWPMTRARQGLPRPVVVTSATLVTSGVLILLWWLVATSRPMGRYLVSPLLMILVGALPVLAACVAMEGARGTILGRTRGAALVLTLIGATGLGLGHLVSAFEPTETTVADQRSVARQVRDDGGAYGSGWMQNPEIRFLTDVPSLGTLPPRGGRRLVSPTEALLVPKALRVTEQRCARDTLRAGGYLLCTVGPPPG